ncbi:D-alanyl-D-alanine carboxypeptidase [Streptomyces sp. NPDC058989]|uniref:D-alanyl-D-alanine carboxypeptidase family protein n=1 Tax=Streptomyces sp. NPDC058989 TaxID=3346686 RepID=UPI003688D6D7
MKSDLKRTAESDEKPDEKSGGKSDVKSGGKSDGKVEAESRGKSGAKPDAESGATGAAGSSAKPEPEPEAPEGAEEAAGDAEGGDDRLRAAVAAWVAEKGDEGDAGGVGDERDADADAVADAGGADAADEVAGEASAKSEKRAGAPGKADEKAEADEKSQGAEKCKGEGKSKGDGSGEDSEPAVTADAKDEAEPKPKAKAEPATKAEPEGEPESKVEPKPKVVDQQTAVFKTVGPQKGKPEEADADADADGSAVDDVTRVFAVAKAKGKGAAAEPVDQATTVFKVPPSAKGKPKPKPAAEPKTEPEATPEPKGQGKGQGKGKGEEEAAEARSVAKTEAKGSAKTEPKGSAKAEPKDAPERDAERTSQFVALKSADDGTADKSLGKTAPKTPTRTSDKAAEKAAEKLAEKPTAKPSAKPTAKPDEPADKASGGATADKASGSLPSAAPAKPTASSRPAGRPGAMPPAATGAPSEAGPAALPESERTKQEPLPPLDLLAKLTNTPPPPETTLRTVVRRFKIWTPLAVLLAIIFVIVQSVRPLPAPAVVLGDAKSSFTFEGGKLSIPWPEHGQAAVKVVGSGDLGTFGEQKPVPTASVAKIMTAYVILKEHPLKKDEKGPQIEVDDKAVTEGDSRDESRIKGLQAGQKFNQQDMIKMLMIPSGNNIARLLARWDSQSANEGAFVKKMNDAAKDLGMKNTTYTDPSGLDPKTVSTAVDQLKLAEAVMKFDAFRPIVAMPNAEIPGLTERIYNNNGNLLLAGLSIKGIKTGSSTAAGGTLSWAAYKTVDGKDRLILGTMMDQHFKGLDPDGSNSLTMVKNNSQKVIAAVREALTSATAVKKGQVVGYVDDGLGGLTPVVATKDLKAVGVSGQKLRLSIGDGGKTVPHEAKAGTTVGVLTVGSGQRAQKVPVALQKDLLEPTFGAKLTRIG